MAGRTLATRAEASSQTLKALKTLTTFVIRVQRALSYGDNSMPEDDSAPTITDSETTIEDNSVTVIVETPPEPEPVEDEPASPTLETVLAMITAVAADVASLRGDMAGINARLDNAESAQAEAAADSNFSETIDTAPPAEPEADTGPASSHLWFRSIG